MNRPPWDPDPRYVEAPEPIVREPSRWPLYLAVIIVVAAAVFVAQVAASRSGQGSTASSIQTTSDEDTPAQTGTLLPTGSPALLAGGSVPSLPETSTAEALLIGTATWCAPTPRHCQGWGGHARLAAMQSFRYGDKPYWVRVCHAGRCTKAKVVSYCACGITLIDLSPYVFGKLAPLSRGRINVTVSRIEKPARLPYLPPTDTEASDD